MVARPAGRGATSYRGPIATSYDRDVLQLRDLPDDHDNPHESDAKTRYVERRVTTRHVDPDRARAQVDADFDRLRDRSSWADVVDGDDVVGWLWLSAEGDELAVYDVALDSAARVP